MNSFDAVRVTEPDALIDFFSDRPAAHIYALVDLEEPFWSESRWYRRDDAVVGLVKLPGQDMITVYAVATRDANATFELLDELLPDLCDGTLITGPTGLAEHLRGRRPVSWAAPHVRYELRDRTLAGQQAEAAHAEGSLRHLDRADLPALTKLYDVEPGAAFFRPHMLDDDSFVGVFEHSALIAAAGTHVLSEGKGCAAVGGVYTHPDHRGQGHGRLATAGAVHRIADRISLIGLNVAFDNAPARSIYETLGFTAIHHYDEALLGDR